MADENALSLDRRRLLETAALAAIAAVMPSILNIPRAFAQAGSTLVIAAPATPQSLDCNFDVSLGTFEAIAALYDGLLGFEKIPDENVPSALREDIGFPCRQAGRRQHGRQAGRELGTRPRAASAPCSSCARASRAIGATSSPPRM